MIGLPPLICQPVGALSSIDLRFLNKALVLKFSQQGLQRAGTQPYSAAGTALDKFSDLGPAHIPAEK